MRIQIPVSLLEFDEGGTTLWVQGDNGTVLRLKCEAIDVQRDCTNNVPHCDVQMRGIIHFCIPNNNERK